MLPRSYPGKEKAMELNDLTKSRLTDDHAYQQVKDNAEGHARAGRMPDIGDLRYIKLAEYERTEEKAMDIYEAISNKKAELEDKHWEECRQIALYDDELKCALKLLTEALGKVNTEWDEAAQGLLLALRRSR